MSRALWKLVPTQEPAKGPYTQLAPLAEALDLPYAGSSELKARINSAPVKISLDVNSGTVVGVIVTIGLEGPAAGDAQITLRAEKERDREGKLRGINHEVQTGDREFDDAIYIDSDASGPETRRVLSKPAVRASVQELIRGHCIHIAIGGPTLVAKFSPGVCSGSGLVDALEKLMTVASAGAPRDAAKPRRGQRLYALASLAMASSFLSMFAAFELFETSSVWPPLFGAVLGGWLPLFARPLIARLNTGDSGSYARYRSTTLMLLIAGVFLGASLPAVLNTALDTSRPVTIDGIVTRASYTEHDEGSFTGVDISWQNGTFEKSSITGYVGVGSEVTKTQWRGGLGFRRTSRPHLKR